MLFWASLAHFIAFGLFCPIRASLSHFILLGILSSFHHFRAPLSHFILLGILNSFHHFQARSSHLFSLGRPKPICFPWASSALFLTSHHHGLLLNSLGFPGLIKLFLILGVLGLAINPLLSLFSLLWVCCGPFSLFHIIYYPWIAFSLFSGSFKPIYLLKTHLFISWAYNPLFPPLGVNGFSSQFTNSFLPILLGFSLPKWASTLSLFKGIVNDDDVCILLFFIIPLLVSWFTSWKFLVILDFYNGTHFFMSGQFVYLFLHVSAIARTHFFTFGG